MEGMMVVVSCSMVSDGVVEFCTNHFLDLRYPCIHSIFMIIYVLLQIFNNDLLFRRIFGKGLTFNRAPSIIKSLFKPSFFCWKSSFLFLPKELTDDIMRKKMKQSESCVFHILPMTPH